MQARVFTLRFKPGRASDGLAAIRQAVQARADVDRDAIGLISVTGLRDPRDESLTVIGIWKDRAALDASATTARDIFGSAGDTLAGPPQPRAYEVIYNTAGAPRSWARMTSGTFTAEIVAARPDVDAAPIVNAASQQAGFAGFLFLLDPDSREHIGVSFWDNEEHLRASETGYYNREMEQARDMWEGVVWQTAVYEVEPDY